MLQTKKQQKIGLQYKKYSIKVTIISDCVPYFNFSTTFYMKPADKGN